METTRGTFVIRVCSGLARLEHIKYTLHIISLLEEAKIPVLSPLKNRKGDYYSIYKNRFVQITPYIQAHPFNFTGLYARESGRVLRTMHHTLASVEAGPLPEWSNYPSESILEEGLTLLERNDQIRKGSFVRAKHLYDRVMQEWKPNNSLLPSTIIHGDWHMWNVRYDTNGAIEVIMDFDFVQRDRLHDVAYMLWALLSYESWRHLGQAFLKGYGDISQAEESVLPVAIARASLLFICTASFNPNPSHELEGQLEKQEPLINWILSHEGQSEIENIVQGVN